MIISVTKEHIKKGVEGKSFRCPIALALLEAGFVGIRVAEVNFGHFLGISEDLPKKVRKFIKDFDLGIKVKPFSFVTRKIKT